MKKKVKLMTIKDSAGYGQVRGKQAEAEFHKREDKKDAKTRAKLKSLGLKPGTAKYRAAWKRFHGSLKL